MNITPQSTNVPLATVVNPPTDSLRRENNNRELIAQPAAASQSAAEKGVASDRERARTPAQNNEQFDFAAIQEKAEQENTTISDGSDHDDNHESNHDGRSTNEHNAQHDADSESIETGLTFEQKKQIAELKQRDLVVRSHERAHSAVGGAFTGAPSYSFETGPDAKKYAVEGEVSVDLSAIDGNPRATIAKMQKVYAAALAPANPSIQDTKVASAAASIIAQAQSQLLAETAEMFNNDKPEPNTIRRTSDVFDEQQTLNIDDSGASVADKNDFDQFIDATLQSQEEVAPSRSDEMRQRTFVIESLYSNITQAYEKPARYQFELTA